MQLPRFAGHHAQNLEKEAIGFLAQRAGPQRQLRCIRIGR